MTLASPLKTVIGLNGSIIRLGGKGKTVLRRTNGADMFIGAWITFTGETENDPDIDLCAKGEEPDGIIISASRTGYVDLDKDSDDLIADNTFVTVYIPEKGDEIYCIAKTNTAITFGVRVQVDGGFLIPWAYTDTAEATDTLVGVLGKCKIATAAVASTETVTLISIT